MHVAIDLGAESGKIVVSDLRQFKVIHRFPSNSVRIHGTLQWNILEIFAEIKRGLSMTFAEYRNVQSIGVDTWGVDYALLDGLGDMLGTPFHYRDSRTEDIIEKLRKNPGEEYIYEATGIQFLPINTIYQLREEVEKKRARLQVAEHFLTIPDLLNYWLCGVRVNEFSIATTTQLYNPMKKNWDWELIRKLDIPEKIFGNIVASGTVLGPLREDVRMETGAPRETLVIAPACHDTASAVAAVPVDEGTDYAYLSSGTWSLLGVELETPLITTESRMANFTNEGAADGGIRFLKNIMGLWILQECRREWLSEGISVDYHELVYQARMEKPGRSIIDVDDMRFLKPGLPEDKMITRIQNYCQETDQWVPETPGTVARIIMESLAQRYAETLSRLQELSNKTISHLYIIGGGSQNELLCTLTAETTGIPVSAGPVEATALGNILMQALACGNINSIAEGRRLIKDCHPIQQFQPQRPSAPMNQLRSSVPDTTSEHQSRL